MTEREVLAMRGARGDAAFVPMATADGDGSVVVFIVA